MKMLTMIFLLLSLSASANDVLTGAEILKKIDDNQFLDFATIESRMIVHGRSGSRTVKTKSWISGEDKSFSEYLSPAREKGKKMLKVGDKLWTYTPEPHDRIIVISGHLLKQSVAGSDLSYEDYMDNDSMEEDYSAKVVGEETLRDIKCKVLELTAKRDNVNYHKRKIWVDTKKWLPIQTDLIAKSGKNLKRIEIREVMRVDNRWYPKMMFFKDLLSSGGGTEYHIDAIDLKTEINKRRFTKAFLRK